MVPQGPTPGNAPLPSFVHLARGRASGTAVPAVAAGLADLLDRDVAGWTGAGFARTKERTVRTVLRGELDGVPVHVKLFRAGSLSDRARDLLRGQRGARERFHLLRARGLGWPVVEPLAAGMALDGDQLRSFVVTRTVAPARPFDFAMAPAVQRRVGALLRALHDGGELPGDLHPGNLLVDAAGQPWLLDLTSLRHAGTVDLAPRARGLAFFCQELDGGALDPTARELLAAYLAAGPALPARFRADLAAATRRWRAAALPAFGRRSTRPCRHTEVPDRARGTARWYWHAGTPPAVRAACERLVDSPGEPQRQGRRGGVWLTADLAMKVRDAANARRCWRAAYWLLFARVAAPDPIALRTFRGTGHVFAARLANVSLAEELAAGRLDASAVAAAARSLGTGVGRLHAHGLRDRDLKFENLVRDPASGQVHVVDLDGVSRQAATDHRGAGADLGRLLAAFRAAGAPGGAATLRTFLRAWWRASRDLLQRPPVRRILRAAERRAGEWASAHRERRG
ncbi:MAG: hypothetical protein FJ265_20775 [Planctomycetes bacterium]|nr:hypothetical protein [Planctomycetota bacterium]